MNELPDNGIYRLPYHIIQISGNDALSFLNGLASSQIKSIIPSGIVPSLFLDTSGKTLQFVLVAHFSGKFYIGVENTSADLLMQYFEYFKVRELVNFSEQGNSSAFYVVFGDSTKSITGDEQAPIFHDRYCSYLMSNSDDILPEYITRLNLPELKPEIFSEFRFALQFPVISEDYKKRIFPHEAGLERYVSFTKGCFVGQEPVSRMEHKFSATKRRVILSSPVYLKPDTKVTVGEKQAGFILASASLPYKGRYYASAKIKTSLLGEKDMTDETGTILKQHE